MAIFDFFSRIPNYLSESDKKTELTGQRPLEALNEVFLNKKKEPEDDTKRFFADINRRIKAPKFVTGEELPIKAGRELGVGAEEFFRPKVEKTIEIGKGFADFSMLATSKLVGGAIAGITPEEGETLKEIWNRTPTAFEEISKRVGETEVGKRVPILPFAAGFAAEMLIPLGPDFKPSQLNALAKLDDVVKIKGVLKKAGMADDVIEVAAPRLKEAASATEVKRVLREADAGLVPSTKIDHKPPKQGLLNESLPPAKRTTLKEEKLQPQKEEKLANQASVLDDSYSKEYYNTPNKSILNKADASLHPTEINPTKAGLYNKFKERFDKIHTNLREKFQDDWFRVRKLIKKEDVKVDPTTKHNPYDAKTRYAGRMSARLEDAKVDISTIDKDILNTSKKLGISDADFYKDIDSYLIARHAPERNTVIGPRAAGISTAEANATLKRLEASKNFPEIKRIADKISDINGRTLDILKEGQIITDDLYNLLRSRYKNHIPLNRIFDQTEDVVEVLSGRGLDVRGTGIKTAKGSEREVADILTNVVSNYEQAIVRAEKNLVDLATLKFFRDNAETLGDVAKIVKPKAIGKTFDEKILLARVDDPKTLVLRENGEPIHIQFKDDHLATAFRGVNRVKLDGLMRYIGAFTRLYSGLMTRFNPDFFLPNKIRDLQEVVVYLAAQPEFNMKDVATLIGSQAKFRGEKAVVDFLRGKTTPEALLYKQMRDDGGTTGGLALSTRQQVELDIEKIRKTNRSNPRKAAEFVLEKIDNLNTVFEDSTRFIIYDAALKKGLSRERAAVLAKESSIDFNKFGTLGPQVNALYMFSNASIQGSVKMLRAMKDPKVAGSVIATVGASVWATNEWNDRVDPDWRNKVSKWDRLNGFPIVYPTDEGITYFVLPVSWGIKPIKVAMDAGFDLAYGHETGIKDAFDSITSSVVDAYNPVGGTDFMSAITPTLLDLPMEIARNKSWTGGRIKPDWDPNAPEEIKFFSSLEETAEGSMAIKTTGKLAEVGVHLSPADVIHAYKNLVGGTGRFSAKVVNSIWSAAQGELPPARETPLVSRFLRSYEEEEIGGRTSDADKIRDILSGQSKERFVRKKNAENLYEQFKKLPKEEANDLANQIKKDDPQLFKSLKQIKNEEDRGLTYTDRLVLQLGIENGERAKFVWEKLKELGSKEEKNNLINTLRTKRVISDKVIRQLRQIKEASDRGEF